MRSLKRRAVEDPWLCDKKAKCKKARFRKDAKKQFGKSPLKKMFWKSLIGPLPRPQGSPESNCVRKKFGIAWNNKNIHLLALPLPHTYLHEAVWWRHKPSLSSVCTFFQLVVVVIPRFSVRRITYPGEIPLSANFGNFADASLFLSDAIVSMKVPPPVISNFKHSSDVFWYPTQKFLWNRLNVNQKI